MTSFDEWFRKRWNNPVYEQVAHDSWNAGQSSQRELLRECLTMLQSVSGVDSAKAYWDLGHTRDILITKLTAALEIPHG